MFSPPFFRQRICTSVAVGAQRFGLRRRGLKGACSDVMTNSTQDQVAGRIHEVKGIVKEKAGELTNNPDLTDEGRTEKLAGTIQKKIGRIKQVFEK